MLSKSVNPLKDETSSDYFFLPPPPNKFQIRLSSVFICSCACGRFFSFSLSFLKHIFIFDQYRLTLTKMNEEQPQLPIFYVAYNNFLYSLVNICDSINYLFVDMTTSPGPGIKSSIIIWSTSSTSI